MSKGRELVSRKARFLFGLALGLTGLTCLVGALALLVGHGASWR
jgi:hypothetical protein